MLFLFNLYKVLWSYETQWTLLRSSFTFMNMAANKASEFLCHSFKF